MPIPRGLIARPKWRRKVVSGLTGTITMVDDADEHVIGCDTSTGTSTINLPPAPRDGEGVWIHDASSNAAVNNITINRGGSDTIGTGAATSLTLNQNNEGYYLVYDRQTANWAQTQRDVI